MDDKNRNTWASKAKRTVTAILPVSPNRGGQCIHCGACCRLPNVCPFLKGGADGKEYCSIYLIRPFNCRKYPRTKSECVTEDTCGFTFD